MAEIKKYLDTAALGTLVEQIKAEDAKVLKGANDYADSLATNYDAAGAAAGALENAKKYTDELANGAVATNTTDIATLKGTGEGSVAKAVADAKALIDADIDAVEKKADKNAEDIVAINDGTNGILAQSKSYTDGQVGAVQGEVADLAEYVGTIPEDAEATDIVGYVQEKTAGIASEDAMDKIDGRLTTVEGDVATIKEDYLKGSDKTELEGKIATAQSAAEGAQDTADTAKAAIDAFLKEADATETAIDTLKEIQAELDKGETSAASLLAKIEALEAIDNATQTELDNALVTVNENIDKKADKTTVDGIEDRVEVLEAIDVATKEYVDQAETDAVSAAKTYSDGLDTAIKARVDALEAIDHEHANKAELDLIATGDKAKWDEAAGKAHEHANKGVIDGITAEKVAAWDASEGNAKTYADGLNTTMQGVVNGIDGRVTQNTTDIATKANADDLDDAVERIGKNETDIATLTSSVNSFTTITSEEVAALFA